MGCYRQQSRNENHPDRGSLMAIAQELLKILCFAAK